LQKKLPESTGPRTGPTTGVTSITLIMLQPFWGLKVVVAYMLSIEGHKAADFIIKIFNLFAEYHRKSPNAMAWLVSSPYSNIQCHMVFQKSF